MFKYRVLNVSSECGQQDRVHNQAEGARGASSAPRMPGMRFPWIEDVKIQDPFVGHLPSLDLLRKCFGPDDKLIGIPHRDGRPPLHHAVINSLTLLDEYMHSVCYTFGVNRRSQLVEVLTSSDTSGLPPLHLAAQEGCYEAPRVILYYATRFDILEALLLARDNRQHIALHHAIRNGQKEVFRLLHGARIKGHTSPCTH